jgi:hypothetical protein
MKAIFVIALVLLHIVFLGCNRWCSFDDKILKPVSWSEVRREIADYICIKYDTLEGSSGAYSYNHGTYGKCSGEKASTLLEKAVEKALDEARPFLIGILPSYVGYTYDKEMSVGKRDTLLQEAYLSSDMFLHPVLTRLPDALRKQGLICHDLPTLKQRPVRTLTWKEFAPYLTAYAWPDKVRPQLDDNGDTTGKKMYSFHICAGINGIEEIIDNPDDYLAYVGFTIAFGSSKFKDLA